MPPVQRPERQRDAAAAEKPAAAERPAREQRSVESEEGRKRGPGNRERERENLR
jgi:hypothetical protein